LFRFLTHVDYPLPNRFHAAADFALNIELRRALQLDDLDPERVALIIQEAKLAGIAIDLSAMGFELEQTIERLVARFMAQPGDVGGTRRLLAAVEVTGSAELQVDLAPLQNAVFDVTRAWPRAYDPATEAGRLIELLAGSLRVRLPAL
jgi:hypothetical protein